MNKVSSVVGKQPISLIPIKPYLPYNRAEATMVIHSLIARKPWVKSAALY